MQTIRRLWQILQGSTTPELESIAWREYAANQLMRRIEGEYRQALKCNKVLRDKKLSS